MITSLRIYLTLLVMAAGGALLAISCSTYPYVCEDYSECAGGAPGEDDDCPGQCVPLPPLDFAGPSLLWMGKPAETPQCPERAPREVYRGYADLDDSHQCAPCECTAPSCALPVGLTTSAEACPDAGVAAPFNAPGGWDGSCTSPKTVPSSSLGSVTFAPVTAHPCGPVQQVPTSFPLTPWGQHAIACAGEAIPNVCANPGMTCLPTAGPPPPGFQQCILYTREGDPTCPSEYPEKKVLYGGLDDTRSCTACECTPTAASDCLASLSIYQQPGCGSWIHSTMVDTSGPLCQNVLANVQLSSMEASWLKNEPGSCLASGGVAGGEARPLELRTFCCQPAPGGP